MKALVAKWFFAAFLCQLAIAVSAMHSPNAAVFGKLPPAPSVKSYRLSLVHKYVWRGCESFAVSASGEYAAIATATNDGRSTIYLEPLTAGHGKRRKLVDFSQIISMSVNAMCWSRSGRYLAICGDGLVGIVDLSAAKPVLRTVRANWIHAIFFKDESALLGWAPKTGASGDALEEINPSTLVPGVRSLPDFRIDYWNEYSPFVAMDDNTIAIVGTGLRAGRDGRVIKSALWGENGLYGITAGPFALAGKPFVIDVSQPAMPHGPHQIFEVEATYLNAYSMDGQRLARIDWPRRKRIESIYLSANGHLFVELTSGYTGSATLYEYQLL